MPKIQADGSWLFDESNASELNSHPFSGTIPRSEHPRFAGYGSIPGSKRYEDVMPPTIARADMAGMIAEMWAKKMFPCHRITWAPRNQASTNFCWGNGPCTAGEIAAAIEGNPHVEWSAASVCCPINGWRNAGGWGADAIEYLASTGACSTSIWPNAAISQSYVTAANADRPNRKVLEFVDVPTGKVEPAASMILYGHALCVGIDAWSHEITYVALKTVGTGAANFPYGGSPALQWVIRNSWGSWGYANENGVDGFADLSESYGTPDDCQAVRQVTASMVVPA